MKLNIKRVVILAILAIFGLSTMAFAWGSSYGAQRGMERNGRGAGGVYMCGYDLGYDYTNNLSSEQMNRLDHERTEFSNRTEDLRHSLYAKELELGKELAKTNPDTTAASQLQSEISNLQGELDQRRLDFEMRARKAVPGYQGYRRMVGQG